MKCVAMSVAAIVALCAAPTFAGVTVSLVPPADLKASRAGEVRFDLLLLNDDAGRADAFAAPATLPCRLTTADGVVSLTASRATSADSVPLTPGGFARVGYVVKLDTVGRVVVELADRPAATVVNVIGPGVTSTTAQSADAGVAASPRASNPLEAVVQRDPNFKSELGLVEYLSYRVKPHEPVYIIAGNEEPSTKFQISFKYQIFDPNGPISQKVPALSGLYFGYTQTSFWDLGGDSSPFFDNSYRPELLVSYDNLDRYFHDANDNRTLPDWLKLGFQGGVKHESNGRDGDLSRSLNIVYARPIITFSGEEGFFLTLAPTVWTYIYDLGDNPDIKDYRGYGDLRVVMGQGGGVQLAATGRMGDDWDHRSLELDLSFPIRQLTLGNLDVYFHAQYFMGWGESLIRYDETDYSLRFGIALVR